MEISTMSNDYSPHERNVARKWWDQYGRHLVSRELNPDDTRPIVKAPETMREPLRECARDAWRRSWGANR
jgi:hypothetical protein